MEEEEKKKKKNEESLIEILEYVLPFLDVATILTLRTTCTTLYALANLQISCLDFSSFRGFDPKIIVNKVFPAVLDIIDLTPPSAEGDGWDSATECLHGGNVWSSSVNQATTSISSTKINFTHKGNTALTGNTSSSVPKKSDKRKEGVEVDFSFCNLLKVPHLIHMLHFLNPSLKIVRLDFNNHIGDNFLSAFFSLTLPHLESLSLYCCRSANLTGNGLLSKLDEHRHPSLLSFNCSFTSFNLQAVDYVANFLHQRSRVLRRTPQIFIYGSTASKMLIERLGLDSGISQFANKVAMMRPDEMDQVILELAIRFKEIVKNGNKKRKAMSPCVSPCPSGYASGCPSPSPSLSLSPSPSPAPSPLPSPGGGGVRKEEICLSHSHSNSQSNMGSLRSLEEECTSPFHEKKSLHNLYIAPNIFASNLLPSYTTVATTGEISNGGTVPLSASPFPASSPSVSPIPASSPKISPAQATMPMTILPVGASLPYGYPNATLPSNQLIPSSMAPNSGGNFSVVPISSLGVAPPTQTTLPRVPPSIGSSHPGTQLLPLNPSLPSSQGTQLLPLGSTPEQAQSPTIGSVPGISRAVSVPESGTSALHSRTRIHHAVGSPLGESLATASGLPLSIESPLAISPLCAGEGDSSGISFGDDSLMNSYTPVEPILLTADEIPPFKREEQTGRDAMNHSPSCTTSSLKGDEPGTISRGVSLCTHKGERERNINRRDYPGVIQAISTASNGSFYPGEEGIERRKSRKFSRIPSNPLLVNTTNSIHGISLTLLNMVKKNFVAILVNSPFRYSYSLAESSALPAYAAGGGVITTPSGTVKGTAVGTALNPSVASYSNVLGGSAVSTCTPHYHNSLGVSGLGGGGSQLGGSAMTSAMSTCESTVIRTYAMILAIEKNDLATVKRLISLGAIVNMTDFFNSSPLIVGILKSSTEIVDELLKNGAFVNGTDLAALSPLQIAVEQQRSSIVQNLINAGAMLDECCPALKRTWRSPLFIACEKRCSQLVELILQSGGSPNFANSAHYTPTLLAYQLHPSWLLKFLDCGAGRRREDRWVLTDTLTCSILKNDINCVQLLLDRYPDLLEREHPVYSFPQIQASLLNRVEILGFILSKSANPNVRSTNKGNSCIHVAVGEGNLQCVKLLLQAKADVNIRNNDGKTPLHVACIENREDMISLLLSYNADVLLTDTLTGSTPLMNAILSRNHEITQRILPYYMSRESLDIRDFQGRTALIIATTLGLWSICISLISQGATVSLQDYNGNSALEYLTYRFEFSGLFFSTKKNLRTLRKLLKSKRNQPPGHARTRCCFFF